MRKSMLDNLKTVVSNTLTDDIKMIDINELHESADNFFVVENIEQFAQTILGQGGVKDNLIVKPLETGGYEIISGHRRRAAVQYLLDNGENIARVLPCLVQDYANEDDKMLDLILMNVSARQISDQELWRAYETLDKIIKDKKDKGEYYGRLRDDIAKTLGVSASQVGKMQNVDKNAIEPVKEAVASGELTISTANEIAKLDKEEQSKITDLSKVQPKDIKRKDVATSSNDKKDAANKRAVDTNNNEIDDIVTSSNDDTSIDDEPELQAKLKEAAIRLSAATEVATSSNDDKYTSNAMKGYIMLAAEEASFSKEQINALLGGMMKALSSYDKTAAEDKYLSR
ncbi:MAG: ParB N-terminal domain-containing protein [Ruminococcus sp.]|uniref:ParB/RepB/Spo0J family partition protein n=1 Tax=Ruminococcus sp. TaxID=41978 RepID=UPI0025E0AFDC|nr:ParB/RepB/Spo0J family partition protein [Ruminococcus sp.]MBR5684378.1 ParB N-terminal domain-containing protein [Ruminococcus sp.]